MENVIEDKNCTFSRKINYTEAKSEKEMPKSKNIELLIKEEIVLTFSD